LRNTSKNVLRRVWSATVTGWMPNNSSVLIVSWPKNWTNEAFTRMFKKTKAVSEDPQYLRHGWTRSEHRFTLPFVCEHQLPKGVRQLDFLT
jgi:hypothetical protein